MSLENSQSGMHEAMGTEEVKIAKYGPVIREVVKEFLALPPEVRNKLNRQVTFDNPTRLAVEAVQNDSFEIRSITITPAKEGNHIRVSVAPNVELLFNGEWAQKIIDQAV